MQQKKNNYLQTQETVQSYPDTKSSTILRILTKQAPSGSFREEIKIVQRDTERKVEVVLTSLLPSEVERPTQTRVSGAWSEGGTVRGAVICR